MNAWRVDRSACGASQDKDRKGNRTMERETIGSRIGSRAAGVALLLLTGASVSGCALFGLQDGDGNEPDPALIADNLVNTLTQLPELDPARTTVQVSAPNTVFGRHVVAGLDDAGYGIQAVAEDQGTHYVRYRAERAETERGERTRYRVAIGAVSVERDYRVVSGDTLPGSAQRVGGAEARELTLNDELFAGEPLADFTMASFEPGPNLSGEDEPGMAAANVAPVAPARASVESEALVRQNLFELRRSNYAPLFSEYEDIRADTLIFANDSLVLGEANKRLVAEYVRALDPATDVLSVIGCSHGRSAIDNGNELLAIGRANRVKEALMFAGLDHDQVLEEGCWAGTYHEVFPRRGVVLTLKRRRDLG